MTKLCIEGMEWEGKGDPAKAAELFEIAWKRSRTDFDKCTASHYLARHQKTATDKLKWNKVALDSALRMDPEEAKSFLPSLYLNLGKCYEDLKEYSQAISNYRLARSYTDHLPEDGYGDFIARGIDDGIERVLHQVRDDQVIKPGP